MIKFSWKKINDKFGWNPQNVLQYFFLKREMKVPTYINTRVPMIVKNYAKEPYPKGPCFIKNIDEVLEGANSPNDLYIYLELASKRNVFDYLVRGVLYLPIALVEEYHLGLIELNPLLKIEKDKIYFKYEKQERIQ